MPRAHHLWGSFSVQGPEFPVWWRVLGAVFLGGNMAIATWGDKRMTVKEVAEALSAGIQTVHDSIDRLFPGIKRNGIVTYLDEPQVSAISEDLKRAHNIDLTATRKVVFTDLEMMEKAATVMAWFKSESDRLRAELSAAQPAIESHTALMRSSRTMSITEASKHFDLHPKTEVFPYLRDHGYLTQHDLPTQAAIDAGYLALRETVCPGGKVVPQAVVLTSQLEAWRLRVIPQIRAWLAK